MFENSGEKIQKLVNRLFIFILMFTVGLSICSVFVVASIFDEPVEIIIGIVFEIFFVFVTISLVYLEFLLMSAFGRITENTDKLVSILSKGSNSDTYSDISQKVTPNTDYYFSDNSQLENSEKTYGKFFCLSCLNKTKTIPCEHCKKQGIKNKDFLEI